MELTEAVRRILSGHPIIIIGCLCAGIIAGVLLHRSAMLQAGTNGQSTCGGWTIRPALTDPAIYSASTRLTLGSSAPKSTAEATALADSARAVVTSPSQVAVALRAAGVRRDADTVAACDVSLQVLGSSNIFELTVTDQSPSVAAAVANSLASGLIQQQIQAYRGQQVKLITDLEAQLQSLNTQAGSLDAQISTLALKAAAQAQGVDRFNASAVAAAAAQNANSLAALRAQRADVAQEINTLTVERQSLLANSAQPAAPSVIDPAQRPEAPDPGRRSEFLLLGLLLGAVIGIGLAALLEAFRPMVVGRTDVARILGVPMLGYLDPVGGKA